MPQVNIAIDNQLNSEILTAQTSTPTLSVLFVERPDESSLPGWEQSGRPLLLFSPPTSNPAIIRSLAQEWTRDSLLKNWMQKELKTHDENEEMDVERDIYVQMKPKEEYKIKMKIVSVERGKPLSGDPYDN